MLSQFLHANLSELVERCQDKAAARNETHPVFNPDGIPKLITQLIHTLRTEEERDAKSGKKNRKPGQPSLSLVPSDIPGSAAKHGDELHRQGLSVDQVVHDYGDLCQAVTELAMEKGFDITVDEFHTFNRCLDDAIAGAVTAFIRPRTHPATHSNPLEGEPESMEQQIRDLLKGAILSFGAIRAGQVGLQGTTSQLHAASLDELRELLDVVLPGSREEAGKGAAS